MKIRYMAQSPLEDAICDRKADSTNTKDKFSPVAVAALHGRTDCVRMLIEAEACVLTPDKVIL